MLQNKIFHVAGLIEEPLLYALLALSVVSWGFILERWFILRKIMKTSSDIQQRIQMLLPHCTFHDLESLQRDPGSPEGRSLTLALKHIKQHGLPGLEEIFNSIFTMERPLLERNLNFLASIGSNAPYIGLFGTVLGIMKAFNDLATTPEAGQQTVMAGISMALLATAAGLLVAIPAVMAYNHFQKQVRFILRNLDVLKQVCISCAKTTLSTTPPIPSTPIPSIPSTPPYQENR